MSYLTKQLTYCTKNRRKLMTVCAWVPNNLTFSHCWAIWNTTIDCGNTSRRSQDSTYFELRIKYFLHWYQPTAMSSQQTMIQFWSSYRHLEIQSYALWCFGNRCLMAWFIFTLTSTISSSIVEIDIDICSVITT